ncbi:MAG TPA: HAD family hydrolase [Thermoanaerobaculia bacterium]|jgi:HAD superfamily hydrolase (TIGR01549 family)|nr:HAD family hydrolase [Thermoanaerobaculia bacterium]
MMRDTVLFDVGGPIDLEIEGERRVDAAIQKSLVAEGFPGTEAMLAEASRQAVESFAPNAYHAMVWQLCARDLKAAYSVWAGVEALLEEERVPLEPREGIEDLLENLVRQGVRLGLVANQPADTLERAGLAKYFTYYGMAGLRKPNPCAFLHACTALASIPPGCIMVGDRIDNDIAPARLLGMTTVQMRTGRHADQQPRSWLEVPHEIVRDVPDLAQALDRLLG